MSRVFRHRIDRIRSRPRLFRLRQQVACPRRAISFGRHVRTASPARIYGTSPVADPDAVPGHHGRHAVSDHRRASRVAHRAWTFSAAVSLAGVASILQTAIQAAVGAQFTSATVAYDATSGSFNFVASSGESCGGEASASTPPLRNRSPRRSAGRWARSSRPRRPSRPSPRRSMRRWRSATTSVRSPSSSPP